jgi:hypothetical protein
VGEAPQHIDSYLKNIKIEWQRNKLTSFRQLVHAVEPDITEDWKWAVPVFHLNGKLVCAMSSFKNNTKFNFFEGAHLTDTDGVFNSGLDSKEHRSINLTEEQPIPVTSLTSLIQQAVDRVRS